MASNWIQCFYNPAVFVMPRRPPRPSSAPPSTALGSSGESAFVPGQSWRRWLNVAAVVTLLLAGVYLTASRLRPRPPPGDAGNAARWRSLSAARSDRDAAAQREMEAFRSEAIGVGQRLVDAYPDATEALCVFGLILSRYGERAQAVQCWQRCLTRVPEFPDACHCLGEDALQRGEYPQAVDWFARALQSDSNLSPVLLSLGKALSGLSRVDEAIVAYERHLQAAPGSVEGRFLLGQAHARLKQYALAKKHHEAALQLDPDCKPAYFGLALACDRLGEKQEAEQARREFARRETQDRFPDAGRRTKFDDLGQMRSGLADACQMAAKVYAAQGELPQAEAHWQRGLQVCPDHAESRLALVALYSHQERWDEAERILEDWLAAVPDQPGPYLKLGEWRLKRQQWEAAEAAFRKVAELAPGRSEGHVALAQLSLRPGGDPAQARAAAEAAVRLAPTAAHYYLLGLACGRCGDPQNAGVFVRRALELEPTNPQYLQAAQALSAQAATTSEESR